MKRIILLLLIALTLPFCVSAEGYEKEQFAQSGARELLENDSFDVDKAFDDLIKGKPFDENNLFKKLLELLLSNAKATFKGTFAILFIGIIISLVSNLLTSSKEETVGIISYVMFILFLLSFYKKIVMPVVDSVDDLSVMTKSLLPVLISLTTVSGGAVTSNLLNNSLLLCTSLFSTLITRYLIPVINASVILSCINRMSNNVNTENLINCLRSFTKWAISIIMIFFSGIYMLYATIGPSLDASLSKTAKFVIGSSVPVIGNVVSDSMATIIATLKTVKNVTGVLGIISILFVLLKPLIRIITYIWSMNIISSVLAMLGDGSLPKITQDIKEGAVLVMICLISISILFIFGIGVLLMSGNMAGMP